MQELSENVFYVGVDDKNLDLFEGQYPIPEGVSYNSYVIKDEKIAVLDTVDSRATNAWFDNLEKVLADREPDFLVVLHMEPDHAANIEKFLIKYPNAKVVSNTKSFAMVGQFFEHLNLDDRKIVVNEGDVLSLGSHTLSFVFAPMVHWPEVMLAFEQKEKILFSADAFGKFGTLTTSEDWTAEARRYYINIVGKYGVQVQSLLKKAKTLDIQKIYPLHGPILTDNLAYYIEKYDVWSSYTPEEKGVLIVYASVYGHTKKVAEKLKEILEEKGEKNVVLMDIARADMSLAVANAFLYDRLVLASVTYDAEIFPCMREFVLHLKDKNYQKRTVAFIENGSWAPMAAKKMKAQMETLKDITFINTTLSIKSAMKDADVVVLDAMAEDLL